MIFLKALQQVFRLQVSDERPTLTLYSSYDEGFDTVEFHIRGQIEVLSDFSINLKKQTM